MNKMYSSVASMLLVSAVLISGCGNQAKSTNAPSETTSNESSSTSNVAETEGSATSSYPASEQEEGAGTTDSEEAAQATNEPSSTATDSDQAANSRDILIIIDQTEKPIENAGMFNFSIQHLPKGYRLDKMSWTGKGKAIVNTYEQAIENGGTGGPEDGSFYISGDGQFSGFSYPESRKGEQGTVLFTFVNDAGNELKWEKKLTLK